MRNKESRNFFDKEFLARKTGKKSEKLKGLKKDLFRKKYRKNGKKIAKFDI